jgi:hypothetical protein
MIFGRKYGRITGMEYAYVFHLFDRVAVGSTLTDIILLILFFLNLKRVCLFSESMDLSTDQELAFTILHNLLLLLFL